jgi:hypothetical protein
MIEPLTDRPGAVTLGAYRAYDAAQQVGNLVPQRALGAKRERVPLRD